MILTHMLSNKFMHPIAIDKLNSREAKSTWIKIDNGNLHMLNAST